MHALEDRWDAHCVQAQADGRAERVGEGRHLQGEAPDEEADEAELAGDREAVVARRAVRLRDGEDEEEARGERGRAEQLRAAASRPDVSAEPCTFFNSAQGCRRGASRAASLGSRIAGSAALLCGARPAIGRSVSAAAHWSAAVHTTRHHPARILPVACRSGCPTNQRPSGGLGMLGNTALLAATQQHTLSAVAPMRSKSFSL